MQQASSGNDEAFGVLSVAAQDELFRLCLANGLAREDAVEATQEVFLRAYAARSKWQRDSDAMSWLCGIAINVVRERRRMRWRGGSWIDIGLDAIQNLAVQMAVDDPSSYEEVWGSEQLEQLLEAVAGLPPRQREAVACRYLRRMSIRETAEAMGCAEGTVKSAVAAALVTLRELLQRRL